MGGGEIKTQCGNIFPQITFYIYTIKFNIPTPVLKKHNLVSYDRYENT